MLTKYRNAVVIAMLVLFYSCSKKYVPQHDDIPVVTSNSNNKAPAKTVTPAGTATRTVTKRTTTPATIPQVIWVNDKVAKKNFDGRLYYDLEGRRYWKNYVDGKYYLFNKAMYNNPAFRPR